MGDAFSMPVPGSREREKGCDQEVCSFDYRYGQLRNTFQGMKLIE
jgi:hypothetical protein